MKKALTIDRRRQGILLGLTKQPEKQQFCLLPLCTLRLLSSCIPLILLAIILSLSFDYDDFTIANGSLNSSLAWRRGVLPKPYIKAEDIVNIRHNVVYNLPKGLIVNKRVNVQEEASCKSSTGKVFYCNCSVKNTYLPNKSTERLQRYASFAVGDACNTVHWRDEGTGSVLVMCLQLLAT